MRCSSSATSSSRAVLGLDDRELAELDPGAGHRRPAPLARAAVRPSSSTAADERLDAVGRDVEHDQLLVRRGAHPRASRAPRRGRRAAASVRAGHPPDDGETARRSSGRPPARGRRRGRRCPAAWPAARRRAACGQVLLLEHLAELLHAPVGDEELEPGPRAQPPVAVVAEHADDAGPDLGDLVERDPDAEALGEHRVGRQAAADPDVEPDAVLGVHDGHERDVVDLGRDVERRVAGDGGLELARQVRELAVADVAAR